MITISSEIQKNGWPCQVVILSIYTSEVHVWRALRLGARGYISKESVGSDLVRAIRAIGTGQYFFSPKVVDVLCGKLFA